MKKDLPRVGIDSHAHLDLPPLNRDLDQVLKRAIDRGILMIGNVFLGPEAYYKNIHLFNKINLPIKIFFVLGIHPHDSKDTENDYINEIETIINKDKNIKAIGEIGLDFYRNLSPKDVQFKVFKEQLSLAKKIDLPVVIHSRDADKESLKVLLEMGFKGKKVLWHCFTKDKYFAQEVLSHGWYVSIPGVITYKNAKAIQEAILDIPLNRILLESDCPFLAPMPFRGKTNEPSYIFYTASKIAELRGLEVEEVWENTSKNAMKFFNLS